MIRVKLRIIISSYDVHTQTDMHQCDDHSHVFDVVVCRNRNKKVTMFTFIQRKRLYPYGTLYRTHMLQQEQ